MKIDSTDIEIAIAVVSVISVILAFWNQTNVRLKALEIEVETLKRSDEKQWEGLADMREKIDETREMVHDIHVEVLKK